jgi:hypothetical protein
LLFRFQFNLLALGIQVIEARNAIDADSDTQRNHDFGFLIHLIASFSFGFNPPDVFLCGTKNRNKKLRFFIVEQKKLFRQFFFNNVCVCMVFACEKKEMSQTEYYILN